MRAQSREDSNGVYQIYAIGQFSPEDEVRIRAAIAQRQQQQGARPGQPPAAGPQPPGGAPAAPPAATPPPAAGPPLQPGEVGPRAPRAPQPRQAAGPPQTAADRPIFTNGSGTGFLVSGQRIVATNNHVSVAPNLRLGNDTFRPNRTTWFAAYLKDGVAQLTPLRLIARNPEKDVSLLSADVDLPGRAFAIADYDPLRDLEVEAQGFPGITEIGSVEADQRRVDTGIGFSVPLSMSQLQPVKTQGRVQRIVEAQVRVSGEPLRARTILHTATISPGNSGGPLFNRCGQVIGMNTFTSTSEQGQARADFSVHTRELVEFMRAQSIQPTVATGFCLFPGTAADYLPHLAGLASLLLGASAVMFTIRRKPQIIYQTAQRVSRVFSRPATAARSARVEEERPRARQARNDRNDRDRDRDRAAERERERPPRPERPPEEWERGERRADRAERPQQRAERQSPPPFSGPATALAPEAHGATEVRLVSLQGRATVKLDGEKLMHGRSAILGRDTASDAVLEETSVSRRHARLALDAAGNLVVTDLGSANGTWRNSRNISTASFAPGEEIRFGTQRYRFEVDGAGTAGGPQWLLTSSGENGETVHLALVPRLDPTSGQPIETEWTVGRNENAVDIVLKSSDVSSNHALLRFKPGQGLQIADRGSSNGTWLHGERVGADFVEVGDSERIRIGETEIAIERA